ncbi:ABC transporter ATP-binding protein [Rhodococcus sp. PAMC28707]|uniref:ABC transporter ATP-binding protein n=1 Tax=unclassified Rhodococcus (in: high G+C Gram-positive bacteria) TaxID=192944 RepID=UPI00109DD9A7|nr:MULTISPECIES: ABC transporter ATP-binding protein [unclassified Rhodococcus (in: high G+C Gram-positive bacteria)]QCB51573.1 ABC transporter ATP-binding protein [Rhodococcus sp. PAMC28705]QCB60259.1 ABC transporter ATP-binding protein [Rhodococcus sp. PAMC28707]
MTDTVLSMAGVDKSFRRTTVLNDCTFSVERGTVTALVGPNGAGKSTTMSLAVGLLAPDRGDVTVLGQSVGQRGITPGLSYLAQHKPLYPRFTVKEILRFGRSTNPSWDQDYASELVEAAEVPLSAQVKSLSPGHRTRVALALALGRRPEVLLLDEPLADLDPVARRDVARTLMRDAAEHGTTIILSSHVLSELVDVADQLLLLRDNRIRLAGAIDDVTDDHYVLVGSGDPAAVANLGSVIAEVKGSDGTAFVVRGPRPSAAPGWQVDDASLDDVVLAHLTVRTAS